jgi:hypothetical protein
MLTSFQSVSNVCNWFAHFLPVTQNFAGPLSLPMPISNKKKKAAAAKEVAKLRARASGPPPPPNRLATLAERVSMLQMAVLMHKNEIVPNGGVRIVLPAIPPGHHPNNRPPPAVVVVQGRSSNIGLLRLPRLRGFSRKNNKCGLNPALTVKLLRHGKESPSSA